jgi:hypothetical protein
MIGLLSAFVEIGPCPAAAIFILGKYATATHCRDLYRVTVPMYPVVVRVFMGGMPAGSTDHCRAKDTYTFGNMNSPWLGTRGGPGRARPDIPDLVAAMTMPTLYASQPDPSTPKKLMA